MQALRHRLVFFAMLALAALTNSPWVHAQEATSLRIGQATTSVSFLAIWAARALDTFKPQGIDLKWAAIPGGDPTVLAALDAGDIDLAAVGTDTPLAAVAKGQRFRARLRTDVANVARARRLERLPRTQGHKPFRSFAKADRRRSKARPSA